MRKIYYTIISITGAILAWFLIAHFRLISPLFLPHPYLVLKKAAELTIDGSLLVETGATLARVFAGLALSMIAGIPLGMIMGYFDNIYKSLEFMIDFLRSIPPAVLFPLFMLFLGVGNKSKIGVVVFTCTFYILINTMYGVRSVKVLRIRVAKVMKLSRYDILKKIVLPESLPHIAAGIRIAASLSVILVIMFEMFAGTRLGLGRMVIDAQLLYETEVLYVGIITAGMIGYLMNKALVLSENRLLHWRGR